MPKKKSMRVAIEIPHVVYKKIKQIADIQNKNIEDIFVEFIEKNLANYQICLEINAPGELTQKENQTTIKNGKKTVKRKTKEKPNVALEEVWLFAPENKEILKTVKKGLKQKGTISRGSFLKYVKK